MDHTALPGGLCEAMEINLTESIAIRIHSYPELGMEEFRTELGRGSQ